MTDKEKARTGVSSPLQGSDGRFLFTPSFESAEPLSTPHTITVLFVLSAFIVYAAVSHGSTTESTPDLANDIRTGIFAALAVGLIFCAEHLRDTLFIRPHPAIWRCVTGIGLFYTLFCTFLLFQRVDTVRKLMPFLDSKVTGEKLPERSYGESCDLTYENIKAAVLDEFVIAHLLGWVFKHMMLRDVTLSMILSVLFELMEYTFEFIQPNFAECWWDHWVLDFLVCNTGGIVLGELLLRYLNSRTYDWAGVGATRGVKGKLKRAVLQFTPQSWTPYSWGVLRSFRRFVCVLAVAVGTMVIELDAFFLKDIFWLPPPSKLNVLRLLLWWAVGMVGLRDYYSWATDPTVKRVGSTAWVMFSMMIMEALVVAKFASELYKGKSIPPPIAWAWALTLGAFSLWVLWWFLLRGGGGRGRGGAGALEWAPKEAPAALSSTSASGVVDATPSRQSTADGAQSSAIAPSSAERPRSRSRPRTRQSNH